jgi:hypothetical protein
VPTPFAADREDQVVRLVISDLVGSGHAADRPDRNPSRSDGLTVDAELSVDGERWALDAMTLRWRPALEGSVAKLEARLEKEFRAQLQALTISSQLTSPRDRSIQARQQ